MRARLKPSTKPRTYNLRHRTNTKTRLVSIYSSIPSRHPRRSRAAADVTVVKTSRPRRLGSRITIPCMPRRADALPPHAPPLDARARVTHHTIPPRARVRASTARSRAHPRPKPSHTRVKTPKTRAIRARASVRFTASPPPPRGHATGESGQRVREAPTSWVHLSPSWSSRLEKTERATHRRARVQPRPRAHRFDTVKHACGVPRGP